MVRGVCIIHGGDISKPFGGTHRVVTFAKALRDAGFSVHLVVPKPSSSLPEGMEDIYVHIVPVGERETVDEPFRGLAVLLKAKKIAKANDLIIQIEHATLAGLATLMGYTNFVLDVHDLSFADPRYLSLPFSKVVNKFLYKLEGRAVTFASKIVVVSNPMKDFIIRNWNISKEKIEVIPNGYFESEIEEMSDEKEENIIVRMGALYPHLDVDSIIRLANFLKNNDEDMKIYLIGDGGLRREIEKRVLIENLSNIIITGSLPYKKAMKLTAKAKICFHVVKKNLATFVSCPVKILDYAALGKPMVLSDVSELSRIFEQRRAALVSSPTNPNDFIENVHKLLNDEALRRRLGENARRVVKDFTWEKQGKKLVKVYEEITK